MKAGADPASKAERGNSRVDETLKSPAAGYGTYHLKHSGQEQSSEEDNPTKRLMKRMGDVFTQIETLDARC